MKIKNLIKSRWQLISLMLVILADSVGNGVRDVIIPEIIFVNNYNLNYIAIAIAIQSYISIFIILPQTTLINKFGERTSICFGVILNIIIYVFYALGGFVLLLFGKFSEGFADSIINSSASKLIYDMSDDNDNRGKYKSIFNMTSYVGILIGTITIGYITFLNYRIILIITIILMVVSLIIFSPQSKKVSTNISSNVGEDHGSFFQKYINKLYLNHIKSYLVNKKVMLLTIPSVMFSSFDIFQTILLAQYLLVAKNFTISNIATMWIAVSIVKLTVQYPAGILADISKVFTTYIAMGLLVFGFGGLIIYSNSWIVIFFVALLYSGAIFYSAAFGVTFGDATTKKNRLSESEVYRTIRQISSGTLAIIFTFLFSINMNLSLVLMLVLFSFSCLFMIVFETKYSVSV